MRVWLQHMSKLTRVLAVQPANAMSLGYSSALYRPTQLSLATSAAASAQPDFGSSAPMATKHGFCGAGPVATEPAFGSTAAAAAMEPTAMVCGDSVDDLGLLAQRADEMGISTADLEPQNMDEILGSMSLGMDMDL